MKLDITLEACPGEGARSWPGHELKDPGNAHRDSKDFVQRLEVRKSLDSFGSAHGSTLEQEE